MWIIFLVKSGQSFLIFSITKLFVLEKFECLLLLVQVSYIPLRFGGLWTDFLTLVELLVVQKIVGYRVNRLLWELTEPRLVPNFLSDVVLLRSFHFVPEIVHVLDVHYQNVTVLVCNNPRVSISTPAIVYSWVSNNVSWSEYSLKNWDCNIIFVREHIEVSIYHNGALVWLQKE